MTKKTKAALWITCVSALGILATSRIALALTADNYCIVLWRVPFGDRALRLPYWTWRFSLIAAFLCAVAVVISWSVVGVERWRARKTHA